MLPGEWTGQMEDFEVEPPCADHFAFPDEPCRLDRRTSIGRRVVVCPRHGIGHEFGQFEPSFTKCLGLLWWSRREGKPLMARASQQIGFKRMNKDVAMGEFRMASDMIDMHMARKHCQGLYRQ